MAGEARPSYAVVGLGCIGGAVGVALGSAGAADVAFLDRAGERHDAVVGKAGGRLRLVRPATSGSRAAARTVEYAPRTLVTDARGALEGRDVVFVATKRTANAALADVLARDAARGATVAMLQNGLDADADMERFLGERRPDLVVLACIVIFNVVAEVGAEGARNVFRWVTPLAMSRLVLDGCTPRRAERAERIARVVAAAGLPCAVEADFRAAQCGKLLINLANAPNALAGCDTISMMLDPGYRAVWAASVREANAVFRAAGVHPRGAAPADAALVRGLPVLLSLPTFAVHIALFVSNNRTGGKTSMLQDLEARALETEIDYITGKVCSWGRELGVATPVSDKLAELVRAAAAKREGSPRMPSDELVAAVGLRDASSCAVS